MRPYYEISLPLGTFSESFFFSETQNENGTNLPRIAMIVFILMLDTNDHYLWGRSGSFRNILGIISPIYLAEMFP